MLSLDELGWDLAWQRSFEPFAQSAFFPGRICIEHKELYHYYADGMEGSAEVSGRLRHSALSRADFPAVGDWVVLSRALGGSQAVIHAILPRKNKFSRKCAGKVSDEQIIAANLDTLFLITSFNRDLNLRRIERYLAALAEPHIQPIVLLNKCDLCDDPEEWLSQLRSIGSETQMHLISARTGQGLDALAPYLSAGRTVAMIGSSGVGKSTLLNRLRGQELQPVQPIRVDDDRGRHTTTHRAMFPLPQGGLLIDNPGIRELQLWDEGNLDDTFSDITTLAWQCRFSDCRHEHEPSCAVQQAIADGELDAQRLESLRKLQREQAFLLSQHDSQAGRERKERERRIHRIYEKEFRRRNRR